MATKEKLIKELSTLIQQLHRKFGEVNSGKLASYIPELATVDKDKFAIAITSVDGETIFAGDATHEFSIQSISKPFLFGLAMEFHGLKHVLSRVGVEPTGDPFHSLIKLQTKSKKPSNPLVNTGAIAMTSLVHAHNPEKGEENIKTMLENYTGRSLTMDENVYKSEKETGHRNMAMAYLMLHFGMIEPDIDNAVDLYFRQCSYNTHTIDLSVMAATLANNGINPITQKRAISEKYVKHLLTLMLTCGLYTYAGEWAFTVGLPAKSGVSGGILAIVPGKMGIAVYSPLIDHHGNSIRGIKVFNELTKALNLHIFDQKGLR